MTQTQQAHRGMPGIWWVLSKLAPVLVILRIDIIQTVSSLADYTSS